MRGVYGRALRRFTVSVRPLVKCWHAPARALPHGARDARRINFMARPWKSHVDFACPTCGDLLALCDEHNEPDRSCLACREPAKLIGIGGPVVQNARWFR